MSQPHLILPESSSVGAAWEYAYLQSSQDNSDVWAGLRTAGGQWDTPEALWEQNTCGCLCLNVLWKSCKITAGYWNLLRSSMEDPLTRCQGHGFSSSQKLPPLGHEVLERTGWLGLNPKFICSVPLGSRKGHPQCFLLKFCWLFDFDFYLLHSYPTLFGVFLMVLWCLRFLIFHALI